MRTVGVTGGIGSGKSYVCDIFSELGIPIYNADFRAKHISDTNQSVIESITTLFGNNAYSNNTLNRKHIASKVFEDKRLLQKLNSIIHPAVEKDFIDWCTLHKNNPYVIKEAAILFETGSYKKLDYTIAIVAPETVRINRVKKRDNLSVEEIKNRINNQWPAEKIMSLADFVIENDGKKLILPQILKIDNKIKL